MSENYYRYALGITSQFYFCSLPLRLDSYSSCQFSCQYCFARARGGSRTDDQIFSANPERLEHQLNRVANGKVISAIDEMLSKQQPIHFGGMSDPFMPIELKERSTLRMLNILADLKYPTIISTKGILFERDEYISVLKRGNFILQFSMISTDNKLLKNIDLGTPGPSRLSQAVSTLVSEGISTACRIQPLLPTREKDAEDVIKLCSAIGVKHVAVEHLKLPVETNWKGTNTMDVALNINLRSYFISHRATMQGREWILPIEERIAPMIQYRSLVHHFGMSFAAADSDLLLLSDGNCCCSGADIVSNFSNFFSHNYITAAKSGIQSGKFDISSIGNHWYPNGSISQFINSHSRLHNLDGSGANIDTYIRQNWNGSKNGNSPMSIYGVSFSGDKDNNGFNIYNLSSDLVKFNKLDF